MYVYSSTHYVCDVIGVLSGTPVLDAYYVAQSAECISIFHNKKAVRTRALTEFDVPEKYRGVAVKAVFRGVS